MRKSFTLILCIVLLSSTFGFAEQEKKADPGWSGTITNVLIASGITIGVGALGYKRLSHENQAKVMTFAGTVGLLSIMAYQGLQRAGLLGNCGRPTVIPATQGGCCCGGK